MKRFLSFGAGVLAALSLSLPLSASSTTFPQLVRETPLIAPPTLCGQTPQTITGFDSFHLDESNCEYLGITTSHQMTLDIPKFDTEYGQSVYGILISFAMPYPHISVEGENMTSSAATTDWTFHLKDSWQLATESGHSAQDTGSWTIATGYFMPYGSVGHAAFGAFDSTLDFGGTSGYDYEADIAEADSGAYLDSSWFSTFEASGVHSKRVYLSIDTTDRYYTFPTGDFSYTTKVRAQTGQAMMTGTVLYSAN